MKFDMDNRNAGLHGSERFFQIIKVTFFTAIIAFGLGLHANTSAAADMQVTEADFTDEFDDLDDDFDNIEAKLERNFLQTDAQLEARYQAVHKAIQAAFNKETKKIEVQWPNDVIVPEGAVWVAYTDDYQERVIYDFEQGYYELEVNTQDLGESLLKLNALAKQLQTNKAQTLQSFDVFSEAIATELVAIKAPVTDSDIETAPANTDKNNTSADESNSRRGLFKPANYDVIASVSAPVPDIDINAMMREIEAQKLAKLVAEAEHGIAINSKGQMIARVKPAKKEEVSTEPAIRASVSSQVSLSPAIENPVNLPVIDESPELRLQKTDNGWALKVPFVNSFQQTLIDQRMQTINKMSSRFDVDVSIILAIIEAESSFNPMATSHIPAFGLMQLVPKTAGVDAYRHVYGKHRILSPDYLYDVENNLELGTAYIDLLQTRYLRGIEDPQNRLYSMIASYNTGVGNLANTVTGKKRIRQAISSINDMQPAYYYDFLQQNLPAQETKNYLNKVIKKQQKYAHLDN